MPDLNFVDKPEKQQQFATTRPVSYNLRVDSRGQEKWRKIGEKVHLAIFFTFSTPLVLAV